jgi:hypothetical protein
VRLTLRTLLAYLDDTLEPTEIKQIGQKVSESDAAQELIARIKQITRRRRLTTPPTQGPGAANFDPNTVAEYLDNALPAEQLAEIEKTCLESDVHLAEIASCHQILTLVLGEPALVPPTARERMYGLVQGKEAIPYRKATAITPTPAPAHPSAALATGPDADRDDTLLLGLPFYRRQGSWLRWALPAAGLLLVAGLAVALWKAMPEPHPSGVAARTTPGDAPVPPAPPTAPARAADDSAGKANAGKADSDKGINAGNKETPEKKQQDTPADKNPPQQGAAASAPAPSAPGKPAEGHVKVGSYAGSGLQATSILLKHTEKDGASWERLALGSPVYTNEPLVSLPGSASEVKLDNVSLLLRGNLPQFSLVPLTKELFECAAVLHPPAPGVDADLTLDRGRLYIANRKRQGPARVLLRFENEVWDVTLEEPDSEVGVDLLRAHTRATDWQNGEEPLAALFLFAVKGRAGVKENYRGEVFVNAPPGPALLTWDNKGPAGRPAVRLDAAEPAFDRQAPATDAAREMGKALDDLAKRMVGDKPVERVLVEGTQSDSAPLRLLCVYGLGAVDEVRRLFDVLGNEEPDRLWERQAAILTLRHWIARAAGYGGYLYDPKTKKGLLTENRKFSPSEAETLLELLHPFSVKLGGDPETFRLLAHYLQSEKHAVRELAWYQLGILAFPVKLPDYNPAWPAEDRAKVVEEVNKLVDAKKLPPPAGAGPGAPAGGPAPGNGREKPPAAPGSGSGKKPR